MKALQPGELFARDYRIVRRLAVGGMGAVYIATQLSTTRERALKLMRPDLVDNEDARKRFEQEARIGAHIASDHIVEVHAAGIDDATGAPYLVMELLIGEDLGSHVRRLGPRAASAASSILAQLSHAIGAAHDAQIVHRDLKPENVFLSETRLVDAGVRVKVLDFGIAKLVQRISSATASVGTPLWMAPEQTGNTIGPEADVWALGLIAYWVLTGRLFWRAGDDPAGSLPMLVQELLVDPIPPASARATQQGACALPEGFDSFFARCVTRDPKDRFHHAREAWAALAPLLGTSLPSAPLAFQPTTDAGSLVREEPLVRDPPFVWPRGVRARVDAFLAEISSGRSRCFIARGPAGIGRTRLLGAMIESSNVTALRGRALRRDTRRFAPLRAVLDERDDTGLREALDRADRDATASDGHHGLEAIGSALVELARTTPTLLVIDDAHFADDATLDIVQRIAARGAKTKLGIVLTGRTGVSSAAWDDALSDLLEHADSLSLPTLDDQEASAVARGVAPLADDVLRTVVASSGGVPGNIVRTILRLWQRNAIARIEGRLAFSNAPEAAAALFEEGSPHGACAVDAIAALASVAVALRDDVIAAALSRAGHGPEVIEAVLQTAIETRLVTRTDEGLLLNDGAREGARDRAGTRFMTMERAILGELASRPDADEHAEILADGWTRLRQTEQARNWLSIAMRRAADGGRFRHATELAGRLATLAPNPAQRSLFLMERAVLLRRAGLHRLARAQLTLVDSAVIEPHDRLRLRIVDAELRAEIGGREVDDSTLAADVDAGGTREERVDVRLALARLVPADEARALMREAASVGAQLDLPRRLRIELVAAELAFGAHDLRVAREHVRDAAALAEAAGILWRAIEPAMDLAVLTAEENPNAAVADLETLEARAAEAGLEKLARLAAMNRATLELRLGRTIDAVAHARNVAARAEEAGDPTMEGAAWSVLAEALSRNGDSEGAIRAAEEAVRIKVRIADPAASLALLRLAGTLQAAGAGDAARVQAQRALEWARQNPYLDLATRARLWIAIHDEGPGSRDRLEAAVAAVAGSTRGPTLALLEEARALLAKR